MYSSRSLKEIQTPNLLSPSLSPINSYDNKNKVDLNAVNLAFVQTFEPPSPRAMLSPLQTTLIMPTTQQYSPLQIPITSLSPIIRATPQYFPTLQTPVTQQYSPITPLSPLQTLSSIQQYSPITPLTPAMANTSAAIQFGQAEPLSETLRKGANTLPPYLISKLETQIQNEDKPQGSLTRGWSSRVWGCC